MTSLRPIPLYDEEHIKQPRVEGIDIASSEGGRPTPRGVITSMPKGSYPGFQLLLILHTYNVYVPHIPGICANLRSRIKNLESILWRANFGIFLNLILHN